MSNVQHVWGHIEAVTMVQAMREAREMHHERCTILAVGDRRKGALFFSALLFGCYSTWLWCKSHGSFCHCAESQTASRAYLRCGTHIVHRSPNTCSSPETQRLLITRVTCDVRAPWCVIWKVEKSPLRLKQRDPWGDAGFLCYKHKQCKAIKKGRKEREKKKATTVMEFIPNAPNITQVLNKGPAMEELVLSSANTLGLPYWGQAAGRVKIALTGR